MFRPVVYRLISAVVLCLLLLVPEIAAQIGGALPLSDSGTITDDDFFQEYDFQLTQSGVLTVEMVPTDGSTLDTYLYLLDNNDVILAENDDLRNAAGLEDGSQLQISLNPGSYTIVATRRESRQPTTGAYTLRATSQIEEPILPLDITPEMLSAFGFPEDKPREMSTWTIFAYYDADNDLEEAVVEDAVEFSRATATGSEVRVLVLIDRHPGYSPINEDWSGTRLYEVTTDTLAESIDGDPLVDFGELDMGDPVVLASFLQWGITNYPAENYALSFGSHGAGWRGVGSDFTNDDSTLTMNDLRQAFETVRGKTDFDRFDLLINDACLMASIEYYDVMSNYADLSIGSAELMTSPGLDMTVLTNSLRQEIELAQIGRELVDQYITEDAVNANASRARDFTYAVTDLTNFTEVNEALTAFTDIINADPQRYVPTLTQARATTYTYNIDGNSQVDLGDFMEKVISVSTDIDTLIQPAQNVIDALDNARIYGNAGERAIERTSYYNIFFPVSRTALDSYYPQSRLIGWEQMLNNYFAYSTFERWAPEDDGVPFHEPQEPAVNIARIIQPAQAVNFNLPVALDIEVEATNISRGLLYVERIIDEDTTQRLLASPILRDVLVADQFEPARDQNVWRSGVDKRDVTWNAAAFKVYDGEQSHFEYLQRSPDDSGTYFLEGRYRGSIKEDWTEVRVTFTPDIRNERPFDLVSTSFISVNRRSGTFGIFEPEPNSELQVYRPLVDRELDDDTGIHDVDPEPGNIYTLTEDGLGALLEPVEDADYLVRFRIETFGQDPQESEALFTVDNSSVNDTMRGQNLIDGFGLTLGVPVWWRGDLAVRPGYARAQTLNDPTRLGNPYSENSIIEIFTFDNSDNINEALDTYLNEIERPEDDVKLVQSEAIDGRDIYEFAFTEGSRAVRGFVTYDDANNRTVLITAENRNSDIASAEALYNEIRLTVRFYDDNLMTASDDFSRWENQSLRLEQETMTPADWVQATTDDGTITFHHPEDTRTRVTYEVVEQSPLAALDIAPDDIRTYNGEAQVWQSYQYDTDYDGVPYIGRLYNTNQNDVWYTVRTEAPQAAAESIYEDIFHPIIDSIVINDLYVTHDWRETLGLLIEVPNPVIESEPYDPWRLFPLPSDNADLFVYGTQEKQMEVYLVDNVPLGSALNWFAQYWREETDAYDLRDANFTELGGQRALEFEVTLTIGGFPWQGRYFAVYSDADAKLYLVGGRSRDTIDREYTHLRNTVGFQLGSFDFFSSLSGRDSYNQQFAVDVDVWAVSEPAELQINVREDVDVVLLRAQGGALQIYSMRNATNDLRAQLDRLPFPTSIPREFEERTLQGREALDVRYVRNGNVIGCFTAVYDEERGRAVVFGANGLRAVQNCNTMRESFSLIPLER